MRRENRYEELYDYDKYDVHHSKIYLTNNNITLIYSIKKMINNFINISSSEDAMDTYKYFKQNNENDTRHLFAFEYKNYIFEVRVCEMVADEYRIEYDIKIRIEPLFKRIYVKENSIRYYGKLYDFTSSLARFLSAEVHFNNTCIG